jgi:hypothetical protein
MAADSDPDFSFGAIFGGLLGFALATCLWTLPLKDFSSWIYEFQTLISGVMALGAAATTVFFLSRQMHQVELFERKMVDRESRSARPLLAFVLVKLLDYSESCFQQLRKLEEKIVSSGEADFDLPLNLTIPSLPDDTFSTLQMNLKFGSESAISMVTKLLIKLQIQNSRFREFAEKNDDLPSGHLSNLHAYMADALAISLLCNRLFPYARGELDEVEVAIKGEHLFQAGGFFTHFKSQEPFLMYLLDKYRDN